MTPFSVDAVVIGAGVIGLACARRLADAGLETLVLGSGRQFGQGVSWRSSEVIHDRPHYAPGSYFLQAIKAYWKACELSRLQPGYAGIRPKIGMPNAFAKDFIIQSEATHGVTGLVNLFGTESPGLTACLATADEVATTLKIS